jgi:hypothetical protein
MLAEMDPQTWLEWQAKAEMDGEVRAALAKGVAPELAWRGVYEPSKD